MIFFDVDAHNDPYGEFLDFNLRDITLIPDPDFYFWTSFNCFSQPTKIEIMQRLKKNNHHIFNNKLNGKTLDETIVFHNFQYKDEETYCCTIIQIEKPEKILKIIEGRYKMRAFV